jgi:hypothetical protein
MARLTTATLRTRECGADHWVSDGGGREGCREGGRLVARITRTGIGFNFQDFGPDGRRPFFPLGPYDADGRRGLGLPAARDRATELSALYRSGRATGRSVATGVALRANVARTARPSVFRSNEKAPAMAKRS